MIANWDWLSGPWAAALTMTLLHFLWQGALWTALGWTAVLCFASTSSHARYAVWLAVLAAMAISPAATLWWTAPRTVGVADEIIVTRDLGVTSSDIKTTIVAEAASFGDWYTATMASWQFAPRNLAITSRESESLASADELRRWQPYLLLGWIAGVLITSLRVAIGAMWVVQLNRELQDWPERWKSIADRLTRRLGLRSRPRLGLSNSVSAPVAVWFWRPVVILPTSWLTETPAEMIEAVIAHELAHIRRHDLWINLLQRAIEALLFFHPCVWWVSRQIRHERELCCDALAVTATGRAVEYARALEWVATWRLASASPLLGTGLGGTRMVLLQRVKRVLGLESAVDSSSWAWGATGLGALAVCVTVMALWTAPVQGDDETPSAAAAANVGIGEAVDAVGRAVAQRGEDRDPPRRPDAPREGERRPDDRPREGERRPDGPRDGDRRPDGPRDGDRPRPEGPRDGDRRPDGPRDAGPRRPSPEGDFRGPPVEEMMRAIRDLREEVERLRREVNELRSQRQGPPFLREGGPRPDGREGFPGPREGGPRPEFRDGPPGPRGEGRPPGEGRPQPPREGERRPDAGRAPEDGRRREVGRGPEGERRPEADRRPEGERPRPEGERRPEQ